MSILLPFFELKILAIYSLKNGMKKYVFLRKVKWRFYDEDLTKRKKYDTIKARPKNPVLCAYRKQRKAKNNTSGKKFPQLFPILSKRMDPETPITKQREKQMNFL